MPDLITFMSAIKQKIIPDSIVYTDRLNNYGRPDVSGFVHYCISHSKEFVDCQNNINSIENFGS